MWFLLANASNISGNDLFKRVCIQPRLATSTPHSDKKILIQNIKTFSSDTNAQTVCLVVSKVIVCVSVISRRRWIIARMQSIGF